jgi:hypothetical protein
MLARSGQLPAGPGSGFETRLLQATAQESIGGWPAGDGDSAESHHGLTASPVYLSVLRYGALVNGESSFDSCLPKLLQSGSITASGWGQPQGRGAAAMHTLRLYGARLRWSKRRPYVIQRSLLGLAVGVVVAGAALVVLGQVSLHTLIGLI